MKPEINNRKDLLLLLLYSPGTTGQVNEPVAGRTRLVKMLFLFKKEVLDRFKKGIGITEENFYQFFGWNFGPFSREVYDDLNFFILRDFITVKNLEQESLPESVEEWKEWLTMTGMDFHREELGFDEYFEEEFCLTDNGRNFTQKIHDSLTKTQKELLTSFKSKINSTPLRAIIRYVYTKYPEMIENSKIKDQIAGNG